MTVVAHILVQGYMKRIDRWGIWLCEKMNRLYIIEVYDMRESWTNIKMKLFKAIVQYSGQYRLKESEHLFPQLVS